MSDDQFINRMMSETFAHESKGESLSSTRFSEENFHRRRGLNRLPVISFEGIWVIPGMARFVVGGLELDIPIGHGPFSNLQSFEGHIYQSEFVDVVSKLVGSKLSDMFVVQAKDETPWLILWDRNKARITQDQLQSLFKPIANFQKAA